MAKKKAAARRSRFADDAALQALVRYEPEESGLKALAQQARADYGVSVRQAQTTGDLTLQAAKQAIPAVSQIYDKAGLDQAGTANLVSPELAALTGPGAATLQRGGALEVAQQLGNLRSAKAAALEDLNTRAVAARQGQQYGILGARQKFTADMAKILGQSQSLARQKGAFTASTIGSMTEAALGRELSARNSARSARTSRANARLGAAQSERGSIRSSGIDPDTGKPIPGGKLDPATKKPKHGSVTGTGDKPVSRDKHLEYQTAIQSIASYAEKYKGKLSRKQIVQKLTQGRPQSSGYADAQGNPVPKGTPGARPYTLTRIPQFAPDLKMTAALDVALDGHLSRPTQRKLAQSGFVISDLNLPTAGQYRRRGGSQLSYDQRRRQSAGLASARRSGRPLSSRPPRF